MRKRRAFALALATTAAAAAFAAPNAFSATPTTVYNNRPAPPPGNLPSLGYEATSTSEFGGLVEFAGTQRNKPIVIVGMSSWGCESGGVGTNDCSTTPGSTFPVPMQLNLYKAHEDGSVGRLRGAVTKTVQAPYRPSANFTKCTGPNAGKWWSKTDHACYNGYLWTFRLNLGDLELPDQAIISVEYDTTHYGEEPFGSGAPCFVSDGGCGYDSLNVALSDSTPNIGSQPAPDDAYLSSTWAGAYCDGGTAGTGTFRLDAGCWTDFQPAFSVQAYN